MEEEGRRPGDKDGGDWVVFPVKRVYPFVNSIPDAVRKIDESCVHQVSWDVVGTSTVTANDLSVAVA
eukprot:766356-Hanusia_phi.AAC.4